MRDRSSQDVTAALLRDVAEKAIRYLDRLPERAVAPSPAALEGLAALGGPLAEEPADPAEVLRLLDEVGSPATMATAGPRFFGFVIGGSLPAALAASWLAAAWDQNAGLEAASPVGAALERASARWLRGIFSFPTSAGVGFVTGATMANFTGLAAGRHALLAREGWDVEAHGLFDAPPLTVVVGEEVHTSLLKALAMLGLGRDRVERVPVDTQGRMRADALPTLTSRTLLCLQAGNVNTGAFDPADEIIPRAREAGAWVHVDGAFGLWAAAAPKLAHLMQGYEQADSAATDAHKWLNVPYDSGLVLVAQAAELRAAMSSTAAYLLKTETGDPSDYTPELSRRARGIEVWAALRALGRHGLAELVEQDCRVAAQLAAGLREAGYEVLNDVVLNQVLVSFGEAEVTRDVIARLQREGTLWAGGTVWQGRTAMRISVSSWATGATDAERSLEAILRVASRVVSGRQ
jgi:glutamate/tyrosine decarboxylase-like PLP-dependent enzyme